MIVQTRENKDLVIPKSLGNFVTEGSGGSGVTPEVAAQIASAVTEAAIQDYDTEIQVDLEDIRDAVSGNSEDIAELSGATMAIEQSIDGFATTADTKAIQDSLENYATTADTKAIQDSLDGFATTADTKAIQDSLADYATTAETQAIRDDLADYATTADTAAIQQSLGDYATTADTKAIQDSLADYSTTADTKAVQDSLANYSTTADTKAVQDSLANYATTADTKAIQDGLDIYATTATTDGLSTDITALSGATSALTASVSALSGAVKEDVVLDIQEIEDMTYADRKVLWDEVYAKVVAGYRVYVKGVVGNNLTTVAYLPLEKYIPETNPSTHTGGFLQFATKDYDENKYLYYSISSNGNISGTINGGGRFQIGTIYSLPTASSSTLGGIKVGSGLSIDNSSKLSVKAGEGLGFSGDTLVVSGVSADAPLFELKHLLTREELEEGYTYTQEELADIQAIIDYLGDYTANNMPPVRVVLDGEYYNLTWCLYMPADEIEQTPEEIQGYVLFSADVNVEDNVIYADSIELDVTDISNSFLKRVEVGGTGGGDYSVVEELPEDANEGQTAVVAGSDKERETYKAVFSDYNSFGDDDVFCYVRRSSDDYGVAEIHYHTNDQYFTNVEGDNWWRLTDYNGDFVEIRAYIDRNDPENNYVEIFADQGYYLDPGDYVEVNDDTYSWFEPAKPYMRTNDGWYQYGVVYDWKDLIQNTSADTIEFVAKAQLIDKAGVPQFLRLTGNLPIGYSYLNAVLPLQNMSEGNVQFFGFAEQWGSSRRVNVTFSNTYFNENGYNESGVRLDNSDVVNMPGTMCIYCDPSGNFGHRNCDVLYDESYQHLLAVKGCELDFSAEYGFGSIVYARKSYDSQNDVWTYYWSLIVPTDTGVKKGVWHTTDIGDLNNYILDSWTAL